MPRRWCVLAFAWPLVTSLVRAQAPALDEAPTVLETRAGASTLFGYAKSPFFVPEFPAVSGHVLLLRPAVARRISSPLWLGFAAPLALTSIRQPAGTYVDEAAWGNPALTIEYDWGGLESGNGFRGVARASLGLPLAEHGPRASQMANRALALADALQALREPSSYTPGVASLTLEYRADFASGAWLFGPGLSVPLLVRVDEAELPSTQTRAVGLRPRADLRAMYHPRRWFGVGAESSVTFDVVRVTEPIHEDHVRQRVQPSIRPQVVFDKERFRVVLSCLAAIGGPVHGSAGCGGDGILRF